MDATRILVGSVQGAAGGDHPPKRLGAEHAAVGVPEVPGLGEVGDAAALVAVEIGSAIQQLGAASGARRRGEHEVERRAARRLEIAVDPARRVQVEATPIGVCGGGDRGLTTQAADRVVEAAESGELDVQGNRARLGKLDRSRPRRRRAIRRQDLRQLLTQLVEGEQRATVTAAQQRERHPLHPGLVQQRLGIEALRQRVGGEEADQRTRRGAADRVDARLDLLLAIQVADGERDGGRGARLEGAERGPAREGQVEPEGLTRRCRGRPDRLLAVAGVVLGVDRRVLRPLLGELVLGEAGVDRARLDAGVAVDALVGVDVELLDVS